MRLKGISDSTIVILFILLAFFSSKDLRLDLEARPRFGILYLLAIFLLRLAGSRFLYGELIRECIRCSQL